MKIHNITRDGDTFVITVRHQNKHREEWTYVREECNGLVSYTQISKDDV